MSRLQGNLEKLEADGGGGEEDSERSRLIEKQYQSDKEKLHKIRLLLVSVIKDSTRATRKSYTRFDSYW